MPHPLDDEIVSQIYGEARLFGYSHSDALAYAQQVVAYRRSIGR